MSEALEIFSRKDTKAQRVIGAHNLCGFVALCDNLFAPDGAGVGA